MGGRYARFGALAMNGGKVRAGLVGVALARRSPVAGRFPGSGWALSAVGWGLTAYAILGIADLYASPLSVGSGEPGTEGAET